jgi:predicted amidohydrolase YtcJ
MKILQQGSIYGHPDADVLVVERDRILAIGRTGELPSWLTEATDAESIDLGGRVVLPGFVDAHIHLLHTGLVESGWRVDLASLSRSEVLETLAQAAKDRDGNWVVAYGWDESRWRDRRFLNRCELDKVAPRSPVLAIRLDGHLLTANSLAMERIPDAAPESLIDREAGHLREMAVSEMTESVRPDQAAVTESLDAAARLCHRLGITSVHTMTRLDNFGAFLARRAQRRLRVFFCPEVQSFSKLSAIGLRTGYGDDWLRFGGVKMFADGSIGAGNAAVSEPYVGGGRGALNHSDEELRCWVDRADRSGWQTVIHAIGDRAIEQVLRVHETLGTDATLRHRIEHVELPVERQLMRAKQIGLHLSMQPNFIANWSGPGGLYIARLGEERDRKSNPLREIYDAGIPLAFGSDGMPPSPLYGLHGAVNGPYPGQCLTVEEAMDCYTANGARFAFEEDWKGRLRAGHLADLVVLDQDPGRDASQIMHRRVVMTMVGGQLVYASHGKAEGSSKE